MNTDPSGNQDPKIKELKLRLESIVLGDKADPSGRHFQSMFEPAHEVLSLYKSVSKIEQEFIRETVLQDYLRSTETTFRILGAYLAGEMTISLAIPDLRYMFESAEKSGCADQAIIALGKISVPGVYPLLENRLNGPHCPAILTSLSRIDFQRTIPYLASALHGELPLKDPAPHVGTILSRLFEREDPEDSKRYIHCLNERIKAPFKRAFQRSLKFAIEIYNQEDSLKEDCLRYIRGQKP